MAVPAAPAEAGIKSGCTMHPHPSASAWVDQCDDRGWTMEKGLGTTFANIQELVLTAVPF